MLVDGLTGPFWAIDKCSRPEPEDGSQQFGEHCPSGHGVPNTCKRAREAQR